MIMSKSDTYMLRFQYLHVMYILIGFLWCLEKDVATHSSILAWREEPGKIQSMVSQRVRHD